MTTTPEERARLFEEADRTLTMLRRRMRDRIVFDAESGTPVVRSVGVSVATIVQFVADEYETRHILKAWPGLSVEDIAAAVWFASWAVQLHCGPACCGDGRGSHR